MHGPMENLKSNYDIFSRSLNCTKTDMQLIQDSAATSLEHARKGVWNELSD